MIRDTTLVHDVDPDYYFTDALSDEAISMIDRAGDEPFFLYLAYTAPHWPLHALEEDIAKYAGVYEHGWDQIRLDRYERLRAMGVTDSRWPMSPRDSRALPWADAPHKQWEARRMATYAAQVSRMDDGIGRIMQALVQRGLRDNTLIVFVSDNGGSSELLAEDGPKRPGRFDIPTRDGRRVRIGNTPDVSPGPEDTFQSYDLPWANVSCTPFRLFKRYVHEGGISTPCIACWPGQIPAGTTRHDVAHFIDLMPTCLDAAQVRFPDTYKGKPVTPLGGHSLLPAMRGQRLTRTGPLYWEHEGNRAIRDNAWKLVAERNGPWELYDMAADRMELTNLADREPGRVGAMSEAYENWAQSVGVAPAEVTP